MNEDLLDAIADPGQEQHFLVNPDKIATIFDAAQIQPTDRVVEVGAGVGTIARHVPACESLTVIELDSRLVEHLRVNVPRGNAIAGDALELLPQLEFDVLLSNLPTIVTRQLLAKLPSLDFRVAVLAVGSPQDVGDLGPGYDVKELTTITGSDFRPPQPGVSFLVRLSRSGSADD